MATLPATLTVGELVRSATLLFDIPAHEIVNGGRTASVARARFAVAWAAQQRCNGSLSQIGRLLGGRQHSTILWAISRAEAIRATDDEYRDRTDQLLATVGSPHSPLVAALLSIQ